MPDKTTQDNRNLDISIEYCVPCDFSNEALSAARELLKGHQEEIRSVKLVPGSGGVFDVEAEGATLFSKEEKGRFPEEGEVEKAFRAITSKTAT